MCIFAAFFLILFVGVEGFRIFNQIIPERVADGIGEGSLLTHQNGFGNQLILFKSMADQIFADAVLVELLFRIDVHDIVHKIQIAEGNPGLQRVDRDAAVCAEHVVNIDFTDPLLGFLLEGVCARGKIGIFVAKQLVGNFTGQDDADVGVLVNPLADKIHADGSADGGDVKGSECGDNRLQSIDHIVACDDDLVMIGVNVLRNLSRIFQIDGIDVHADGEGLQWLVHQLCGSTADKRRVKAAGEQVADRCIGIETLLNSAHQLVMDVHRNGIQIILTIVVNIGHVTISMEGTILIIAAGRERKDLVTQLDQVLRLRSKDDDAIFVIAVIQRADSDRIAGSDVLAGAAVKQNQRIFRIQKAEHIYAVLFI